MHAVAPRTHVNSIISAPVFCPCPTNSEAGAAEAALDPDAFFKRSADSTPVPVASVPISPPWEYQSTTRTLPVPLSATNSAPSLDHAKPAGECSCPVAAEPSVEPAVPLPNVRCTNPSASRTCFTWCRPVSATTSHTPPGATATLRGASSPVASVETVSNPALSLRIEPLSRSATKTSPSGATASPAGLSKRA